MLNNVLLISSGGGGNSPILLELKIFEGDMCDAGGGFYDFDETPGFRYSGKMLSPYAIIQHRSYNDPVSNAGTVNFNIGSARISDGYTMISSLGDCGPISVEYIRMCWADSGYRQISDWSSWIKRT